MNRFQMLRVFVLMTLRGREVPLQDLVVEYGMEEELNDVLMDLEDRIARRCDEYSDAHVEWEKHVHLNPIYDAVLYYDDPEPTDWYETYDGPSELQDRMDRAKRRHDRLYRAVRDLKTILNPADKWEGIPF